MITDIERRAAALALKALANEMSQFDDNDKLTAGIFERACLRAATELEAGNDSDSNS